MRYEIFSLPSFSIRRRYSLYLLHLMWMNNNIYLLVLNTWSEVNHEHDAAQQKVTRCLFVFYNACYIEFTHPNVLNNYQYNREAVVNILDLLAQLSQSSGSRLQHSHRMCTLGDHGSFDCRRPSFFSVLLYLLDCCKSSMMRLSLWFALTFWHFRYMSVIVAISDLSSV